MVPESQLRGKESRFVALTAAAAKASATPDPQRASGMPLSDVCTEQADMSAVASASLPTSDASPTGRGGRWSRGRRSVVETGAAVASNSAAAIEGAVTRSVRRAAGEAKARGAGSQQGGAVLSAHDAPAGAGERPEWAWTDNRGLRRSLRQALLLSATAKTTAAVVPAASSEATVGASEGAAPASAAGAGTSTVSVTAPAGPAPAAPAASGPVTGTGRKRLRQLQRQLLQSYIVGQHQQSGSQEETQQYQACLAEFLDLESRVPCCCCGNSCVSSATCGCRVELATYNDSSSSSSSSSSSTSRIRGSRSSSSSSSSRQTAAGAAARVSGAGASVRSTLEVYTTSAAKRQRHHQNQQQQQQQAGSSVSSLVTEHDTAESVLMSPSWFAAPADAEELRATCIVRPASPTRASTFFASQAEWETADTRDSAEHAAATAGTPWPRGSTSCSFGGYGAATRAGGAVPLCCHCGMPLRPPASGVARGAGAETGCPLAAAASAANALGLDSSMTQWCRCCTRVYGELRLQHHRDATSLPFNSFSLPRSPLRFVLLSADSARDLPGGVGAVAATVAAAAADPRRGRHAPEDSTATPAAPTPAASAASPTATPAAPAPTCAAAPAATLAEGERDGSHGNNSSSTPNLLALRRTRSGCHFPRTPPARTSGRSSNVVDISRFRSASCCWPSNFSRDAYVQPVARLQQQLTQLLQPLADLQPQHQQQHSRQASPIWKAALFDLQSRAAAGDAGAARPSSGAPLPAGSPAAAAAGISPGVKAEAGVEDIPAAASTAAAGDSSNALCVGATDEGDRDEASKKPEAAGDTKEAAPAATKASCASGEAAAENFQKLHSSTTSPPAAQQQRLAATTAPDLPQRESSTAVLPRVYLESSSSCYVATGFDPSHRQLLQKRFCCLILGEQRAHALACQWLRWVDRGCCSRSQ